jgi:hypothetical protein
MSTTQGISHLTPRVRIGFGTVLAALGVLVAIAVTIGLLALTSANHTAAAIPSATSPAVAGSAPEIHYLGPRQTSAALSATTSSGLGASDRAPHITCLGDAQRCLR